MPVLASLDPCASSIAAIGKADRPAVWRRQGQPVALVGPYVRGGAVRVEPMGLHFHLRFEPQRGAWMRQDWPTEVAFQINGRAVRVYRILTIDFTLGTALCGLPMVQREATPLRLPEVIDVSPARLALRGRGDEEP